MTEKASFVSTHGVSQLHIEMFDDGSAILIMRDTLNDESQRMAIDATEARVMRDTLNAMIGD